MNKKCEPSPEPSKFLITWDMYVCMCIVDGMLAIIAMPREKLVCDSSELTLFFARLVVHHFVSLDKSFLGWVKRRVDDGGVATWDPSETVR